MPATGGAQPAPTLRASAPGARGTPRRRRAAAYFDLDKTILATSTAMALGVPMHRSGLISSLALARGAVAQLPYLLAGVDAARASRLMEHLATMSSGVSQQALRDVVEGALLSAIEPAVYAEALDLIEGHHRAGHDVVVVSASMVEMVEPVARLVGADRAVATRMEVNADGLFTGRIERSLLHDEKAVALAQDAAIHDIDLSRSWAYSDSISDEPLLRAVGHPVAVNPDRELRRLAEDEGWPTRDFARPVQLRAWRPQLTRATGLMVLAALVAAGTALLVARRGASPRIRGPRR